MGNVVKYILEKAVLVFIIVVYVNILGNLVSRSSLNNFVIELFLLILTIILAIITTEVIFRNTRKK